jgi:DNA polymerase-4
LPVEALWGVGDRTAETLRRLGLTTVGHVAEAPLGMLRHAVGEAAATQLHELAWARDPRPVDPRRVEKSIGAETTFDIDISDAEAIRRAMLALSTKVGSRLRRSGQAGRTVALKLRLADFTTLARSRTLRTPTDVGREIFDTAWSLFTAVRGSGGGSSGPIRLVGVRVEGLIAAAEAPRQPVLGERDRGWREAERAADAAVTRFGSGAIRPASLLGDHGRERILDPLSDPLPPS